MPLQRLCLQTQSHSKALRVGTTAWKFFWRGGGGTQFILEHAPHSLSCAASVALPACGVTPWAVLCVPVFCVPKTKIPMEAGLQGRQVPVRCFGPKPDPWGCADWRVPAPSRPSLWGSRKASCAQGSWGLLSHGEIPGHWPCGWI